MDTATCIPEASGLRGSIRLIKLVSHLLARAHNLAYGAKIYQTCIKDLNIYQKLPIHRPSGYYVSLICSSTLWGAPQLFPTDLEEALENLGRNEILNAAFGEKVLKSYLKLRYLLLLSD